MPNDCLSRSLRAHFLNNRNFQFLSVWAFQEHLVLFSQTELNWVIHNPVGFVAESACSVLRKINKAVRLNLEHVQFPGNRRSHSANDRGSPTRILHTHIQQLASLIGRFVFRSCPNADRDTHYEDSKCRFDLACESSARGSGTILAFLTTAVLPTLRRGMCRVCGELIKRLPFSTAATGLSFDPVSRFNHRCYSRVY
jgi:hypothetical protein